MAIMLEVEEPGSPCKCVKWIRIFNQFDVNNDGYIPTRELKQYVRESARLFGLNPNEATKLLENVDINKDHLIDFSEFCLLMSKAKKMRMRRVMFLAAQMVLPRNVRTQKFTYLQQYNCFPPPLFMLFISVIEVNIFGYVCTTDLNSLVFLVKLQIAVYTYYVSEMKSGLNLERRSTTGISITDSPLIFNPHKKQELWRYFTYMLVHIDIFHLVLNILAQLVLGVSLELVHKLWRIAAVYFSGVLAGSLLVSVVDPNAYLAGASGGVYALLAAHISDLLINWSEMEFAFVRAIFLGFVIVVDFGISAYQRYFENENKVSYASHIAGFVAGVLMGVVVLRNFRKRTWEAAALWTCIVTLFFLTAVLIILQIAPEIL
uniref:Rhomboid protease n=1 Tax=Syphacia muris TaxID=451379 RepID=A0A0N5AZW2_9BILA